VDSQFQQLVQDGVIPFQDSDNPPDDRPCIREIPPIVPAVFAYGGTILFVHPAERNDFAAVPAPYRVSHIFNSIGHCDVSLRQKCKIEVSETRIVKEEKEKTDVSLEQQNNTVVKNIFIPGFLSSDTTLKRRKKRKKRQYLHS
jgi:hypothetical protein